MKRKTLLNFLTLTLLCLLLTGCKTIAYKQYSQVFVRVEEFSEKKFSPYFTWNEIDQNKYSREEVFFYSGANKLQGFIYGNINNKGLVVISEGLGATADSYFPLIMNFVDQGWRVFAFNNTGVSGSEGDGTQGLCQSVIDLDAALTFVEKENRFANLSVMLVGHSWGGYAVCAVLSYPHRVSAVVSFAGFNYGRQVIDEIGYASVGKIYNSVKPHLLKIEKQRFGDIAQFTAVDGINSSDIPVMIVQCSNDNLIRPETTSIYAHREKITNPNVQIVFREGDEATGHIIVWASQEQKEYMKWVNASWKEYYKANRKKVTLAQWAAEVNFDKKLANEVDAELMKRINVFFDKAR
jgi:pimeloyl-ACP methyl ester carboxylesterase